nr:hypothetical protein [Rhodococcus sp. JVH1]EJI98404.1 hypothetical protein JVH1_4272 [Rhodococcus sp. JVH1]
MEHLTGDLRASFELQALAQTRADMDTVQAMSGQLQSQTLPALPKPKGLRSCGGGRRLLGVQFPA